MQSLLNLILQKLNSLNLFFSAKRIVNKIKNYNSRNKVKIKNNDSGYSSKQIKKNVDIHKRFDPTSRIDPISYILNKALDGNLATGEEDQYWRAYLGMKNKLPIANRRDLTELDYLDELDNKKHSDFYGITPKMKYYIEAMADSTGLGRLVRDGYVNHKPLYEFSKKLLNNPKKWLLADDETLPYSMKSATTNQNQGEYNPLGMLAHFGMMWDPDLQRVFVKDVYDFPRITRIEIPKRPNLMKIRGSVYYSPNIGSTYYRTGGDIKYVPKSITQQ